MFSWLDDTYSPSVFIDADIRDSVNIGILCLIIWVMYFLHDVFKYMIFKFIYSISLHDQIT